MIAITNLKDVKSVRNKRLLPSKEKGEFLLQEADNILPGSEEPTFKAITSFQVP